MSKRAMRLGDKTYEYIGNLHIHSVHSDGAGSIKEIAEFARGAGLDFIGLNDHEYMTDGLHLEEEGYYGSVLVLVGLEIGTRFHHYLSYDLKEWISSDGLSPQEVIDGVNDQGGFGFLAHPFEKGMPFSEKSIAYTWNDLTVKGYRGISIWNFASRWKERIKTVLHGLFCLAFKKQTLKGPSRETLAFWDQLCQERRVPAIGASDAHGSGFKWGPIRIRPLSYAFILGSINIHIFLDQRMPDSFQLAKQLVYDAMKAGRLFVAHDNLCPSRGFRFEFFSDRGSKLIMGEEMTFEEGDFRIELPHQGEIRLIRDGRFQAKTNSKAAEFKINKKGVYRVEVYHHVPLFGWRPWIFTNPIYLR